MAENRSRQGGEEEGEERKRWPERSTTGGSGRPFRWAGAAPAAAEAAEAREREAVGVARVWLPLLEDCAPRARPPLLGARTLAAVEVAAGGTRIVGSTLEICCPLRVEYTTGTWGHSACRALTVRRVAVCERLGGGSGQRGGEEATAMTGGWVGRPRGHAETVHSTNGVLTECFRVRHGVAAPDDPHTRESLVDEVDGPRLRLKNLPVELCGCRCGEVLFVLAFVFNI